MVKSYKHLNGAFLILLLTTGPAFAEVTFENPYANPYQQTQQFICYNEPSYHCEVPYTPGIYPGAPILPAAAYGGVGYNPYMAAAYGGFGNPYAAGFGLNPYSAYGGMGYNPYAASVGYNPAYSGYAPDYTNDQDMNINIPSF